MQKRTRVATITSYVLSGLLWALGILTLLYNILGLWEPWHLAGIGFLFYIPVPIFAHSLSIVFACEEKKRKGILITVLPAIVSLIIILFTILVSYTWFW